MTEQQQLPPGATAIDVERFFAAIGELYFQVRELRLLVARQQQQASRNGTADDAVHLEL